MTSRRSWRRAWVHVRRDWPAKVAAVMAALVLWWIAENTSDTTVQRSLLVDLAVVGIESDEVAVGVPVRVEVVVTGPSERMARLSADDVDATLDVTDVDGSFERSVEARVPQTLRVVGVVPAEVIGRIEAVRGAEFPIEALVRGHHDDLRFQPRDVDPAVAIVEARDPVLAEVSSVIAVVDAARLNDVASGRAVERSAPLVAVDAEGRPVGEVRIVPSESVVTVDVEPLREDATVTVQVATPPPNVVVGRLNPSRVTLIGPPPALRDVTNVTASVPGETALLPPGEYPVTLDVSAPMGVAVVGRVTAVVTVRTTVGTP